MTAPRRVDARRNRAAILRVVTDSVGRGLPVPTALGIARLTGLGQATVYRHFPDRKSLLRAVTDEHLALLRRASARAADNPAAFRPLLNAVLHHQVSLRPVVAEMRRFSPQEQQDHVRRLLDALRAPFARSQAAGHLKPHLALDDVATVLAMLQAAIDLAPDPHAARWAIPVLIDGLFAQQPSPGLG